MEENKKPHKLITFEKLSEDLQQQVKLVYSEGFADSLIEYKGRDGANVFALRFETDDVVYLIKMSEKRAEQIILDDDDYDDSGNLTQIAKQLYGEKYSDRDYLSDNNDFSFEEDES